MIITSVITYALGIERQTLVMDLIKINKIKIFRDSTTPPTVAVVQQLTHQHTAQEEKLLGLLTNEVDPKPPVDDLGRDVRDVPDANLAKISTVSSVATLENVERRDSQDVEAAQIVNTVNILHVLCFWC